MNIRTNGVEDYGSNPTLTQAASPVRPHGGVLVDRFALESERKALLGRAAKLPRLELDARTAADAELIATGAFSPLEGFLGREDYLSVIRDMKLASGRLFPIPITLAAPASVAAGLRQGDEVALSYGGEVVGTIRVEDKFAFERDLEAKEVYRTGDGAHPGVKYLDEHAGDVAIGGRITLGRRVIEPRFPAHHRDPREVRALLAARGWKRTVAFQTRNPIHRAHEYLLRSALEIVDGLVVHPLVGETKGDDVPASVRVECYEVLLSRYFPEGRTLLSVFPAAMRYAGPREAVLHAVARQNYGFSHFIVGRDHAGVGNYYGTYDAQKIFERLPPSELAITPLFFEHSFYCKGCRGIASHKTCPHPAEQHLVLSGSKVRELLAHGEALPEEFTRPEVADILRAAYRAQAGASVALAPAPAPQRPAAAEAKPESSRREAGAKRGLVIWMTGLSGAGKTTLADGLVPRLVTAGRHVEVLDGDVVRTHLSKGLGFSREDRDTNIARIAFVGHLLARAGATVIVAAISPFRETREKARQTIGDFVEVHVAPPLEECIRRDVKGLYKKAIAGEIAQFTGVSDPYEPPNAAEVTLDTSTLSVEASIERIWEKLAELGYVERARTAAA
jgi:sulfate adenylyltransferase